MIEIEAYMLFSSSGGNSAYVRNGNTEILIDAGVSAKQIEMALAKLGTCLGNIKAIFVTHEHIDHIKGLDVICRHYPIPVYAPYESCEFIASTMPWTNDHIIGIQDNEGVSLENMEICPFSTPHDALGSVGYRLDLGGSLFGYATDIGHLTDKIKSALSGCKNVVIESNYDLEMLWNGVYPPNTKKRIAGEKGHLSNGECAAFLPHLARQGAKNFVLAHLSENCNKPHYAHAESRGALNAAGFSVSEENNETDIRLVAACPRNIVRII